MSGKTIMATNPECGHVVGAVVKDAADREDTNIARWAREGYDLETVDTEWFRENAVLCDCTHD